MIASFLVQPIQKYFKHDLEATLITIFRGNLDVSMQ